MADGRHCAKNQLNPLSRFIKSRLHDTTGYQTGCTTGMTTGCIVYIAGCQTGCTTRFDNQLNEQWLFVQHGCQTVFVKPVIQPV